MPDIDSLRDRLRADKSETRRTERLGPRKEIGDTHNLATLVTRLARLRGLQRNFDGALARVCRVHGDTADDSHLIGETGKELPTTGGGGKGAIRFARLRERCASAPWLQADHCQGENRLARLWGSEE